MMSGGGSRGMGSANGMFPSMAESTHGRPSTTSALKLGGGEGRGGRDRNVLPGMRTGGGVVGRTTAISRWEAKVQGSGDDVGPPANAAESRGGDRGSHRGDGEDEEDDDDSDEEEDDGEYDEYGGGGGVSGGQSPSAVDDLVVEPNESPNRQHVRRRSTLQRVGSHPNMRKRWRGAKAAEGAPGAGGAPSPGITFSDQPFPSSVSPEKRRQKRRSRSPGRRRGSKGDRGRGRARQGDGGGGGRNGSRGSPAAATAAAKAAAKAKATAKAEAELNQQQWQQQKQEGQKQHNKQQHLLSDDDGDGNSSGGGDGGGGGGEESLFVADDEGYHNPYNYDARGPMGGGGSGGGGGGSGGYSDGEDGEYSSRDASEVSDEDATVDYGGKEEEEEGEEEEADGVAWSPRSVAEEQWDERAEQQKQQQQQQEKKQQQEQQGHVIALESEYPISGVLHEVTVRIVGTGAAKQLVVEAWPTAVGGGAERRGEPRGAALSFADLVSLARVYPQLLQEKGAVGRELIGMLVLEPRSNAPGGIGLGVDVSLLGTPTEEYTV